MSGADDTVHWWTTDHRLIRELAHEHGAVPVLIDRAGDRTLQLQTDPGEHPGDRIPWAEFFEAFEAQSQTLLHRSSRTEEGTDSGTPWELLNRDAVPAYAEAAKKTAEPTELDSDQLALSDTGESEPVTFDRTETDTTTDDEQAYTAETKDHARTATGDALVLDTIQEHPAGLGAVGDADESVTFRHAGEQPLDVSGWTVRNGAGTSYRIPDGVTLDPGDHLTIHGSDGTDTDTELYWDASDPVWPTQGGTVIVETRAGDRVIEADYKGGR